MNCQKASIYISGSLDGELTAEQQDQLDEHLATCQNCRKEYEELLKLKEVTSNMRFSDLPDRYWASYWNNIYNRLERGIGWIFISIAAIILLAYGLWNLLNNFFVNETIPIVLRIGVGFGLLGLLILLVSILREKIFARKHERYKEVER
jgi:hypothetical protein